VTLQKNCKALLAKIHEIGYVAKKLSVNADAQC